HGGFVVRELGLFDIDGDLIAYGNYPDIYKALPAEGTAQDLAFKTTIQVAATADVTLVVDANVIAATRAWVKAEDDADNHLPSDGTIGQTVVKTGNGEKDYEWQDPTEANVVVNAVTEEQALAASQTVINLATVTTVGTAYYIDGNRMYPPAYTVNSSTQITLTDPAAGGEEFLAVQNEPNSQIKAPQIEMDPPIGGHPSIQQLLERLHLSDPAGRTEDFAGTTPPGGWLFCDGSEVSRTQYPALFTAIGTLWGDGDGSTTFNLPDLRNDFRRGCSDTRSVGDSESDQIKSHSHSASSEDSGAHTHGGRSSDSGAHKHRSGWGESNRSDAPFGATSGSGHRGSGDSDWDNYLYYTDTAQPHFHWLIINQAGSHSHPINIEPTGGDETRPRNKVLMPIIRAY
ncbi:Phage Tail Collar Domain family, partial [gamma proteobacterium HTCC5015]